MEAIEEIEEEIAEVKEHLSHRTNSEHQPPATPG